MEGYAARETALLLLVEHEERGAFLRDLFPERLAGLPERDRGLVRQICLGVLRHRALLDHNIDARAKKRTNDRALRNALRLSLYQLYFMDSVPAYAAVGLGVELVKRRLGKFASSFANALLQRASREGLLQAPGQGLEALAVNASHPLWLLRRWEARAGLEGARRAAEADNRESPLWLRFNPLQGDPAATREALERGGYALSQHPDFPLFARLQGSAEGLFDSPEFRAGRFAVQDPASWLVTRLLDWKPGLSLLDLCSAPGGKSASAVEAAAWSGSPDAHVSPAICNDISFRRLRRLRDARERLGHRNLLPVVSDPGHPALKSRFDRILVDAPCSNLGVLCRRPEAKWNASPEEIRRQAEVQARLLREAAAFAHAGSSLVYATCSPEPEETVEVVQAFLKANPAWRLEPAETFLPERYVKRGFLWLEPGETECDGFFAARLALE